MARIFAALGTDDDSDIASEVNSILDDEDPDADLSPEFSAELAQIEEEEGDFFEEFPELIPEALSPGREESFGRVPTAQKMRGGGLLKGLGTPLKAFVEGLTGGKTVADVAREAGGKLRKGPALSEQGIEATEETLPPVYVADDGTVDQVLDEEESFGLVSECVRPDVFGGERMTLMQARRAGKVAADQALARSAPVISGSARREPAAFLEDRSAKPVLKRGGILEDAAYGALTCAPCPCCRGDEIDCPCCDRYGVILIPRNDAATWKSAHAYDLAPVSPRTADRCSIDTGSSREPVRVLVPSHRVER